jgi:hypothetical protein
MSADLRRLADDTTRRVNVDSVARMQEILEFAASTASDDPARLADFTEEAKEEAERASRSLEAQVNEATFTMIRAIASPPRVQRVRVWQAAGAAALALGPLAACGKSQGLPPPDPLPPPTYIAPMPPDPLPPPTIQHPRPMPPDPLPSPVDAGLGSMVVDPLPPPTVHKPQPRPMPPDPLPRPFDAGKPKR